MNTEILAMLAILLPILIALTVIRRRRPAADAVGAVETAVEGAPYWAVPTRWYRAADGRFSWTHEWRGELERGPFFTAARAYSMMNGAPAVRWLLAKGTSSAVAAQGISNVMCYYPVDDPRQGDGVTAREISRALKRALALLADDLVHPHSRSGKPSPHLAGWRVAARLRREANDDGSWLVAADLLNEAANKSRTIDEWLDRVAYLLQAVA